MYIEFCKCGRRILTIGQKEKNLPCKICQDEEHAKSFKNRLDELNKEEV